MYARAVREDATAMMILNDADARLWHPWLRINRVLRATLHERRRAAAWPQVKTEFTKALALESQTRPRLSKSDFIACRCVV